ncbi:helix-turn-helix domain-containing protein [Aquiflexum balticum]|nr:helix-turn-helix domain-containing protein [Aquiflexum balticum]
MNTIKLPIPPHRKTVYDLVLVTHGEALRTSGLNNYTLKKQQIFFMPANQITSTPFISKDIKGYYFHFSLGFVESLQLFLDKLTLFKTDRPPLLSLDKNAADSINQKLAGLESVYLGKVKNKTELIALKLMELLFEIETYLPDQAEEIKLSTSEKITGRFKQLVNEKIRSFKKVSDYADFLNITPNHLNKCVKSVTGKSSHYWIQEMLLLESKTLLNRHDLSIADISFELNFEDVSYFSRFFKANTGISPSAYRKKVTESLSA